MPEFSGDRNYQGHHTRTEGLSVEDRYEKGVVLTHWLSGMLQPQHLTGPYLLWADCTAWYASVMFVRKKRHRSESMMSQKKKKRASDINLLPCGFCMTVINCLFVSTLSFRRRSRQTHPAQFSCMAILWCTSPCCAYMPERVYILAVMLSCEKVWSQEPIVIIPSWWQIRPSPLVVIAALHELHQLLWLAEPLTVRVGVSIWGLSAPIRAGTKTAAQHIYHRAAHSTKGCKKYTESMWEGLSVIHSSSIRLCCSWHKWTCSQTTRNAHWSSSTSQTSHLLLLVGQEAKGHVDRYNLCSLALVQSSLFLCATFMPQIDF